MSEYEIKNLYKSIKKDSQYVPIVNKIDNIKRSLTPKQLLDLQSLLVNASNYENTLKNNILLRLDKKINDLEVQNKDSNTEIKQLDTYRTISRSISINRRKLKNKKTQRKRKSIKKLSPIIEETDSQTNSTGGRKSRKNTR
jgi:hypothetical protein